MAQLAYSSYVRSDPSHYGGTVARTVAEIISRLQRDPWRDKVPFSPDIQAVHDELFRAGTTEVGAAEVLATWLRRFQPCLFGKIVIG